MILTPPPCEGVDAVLQCAPSHRANAKLRAVPVRGAPNSVVTPRASPHASDTSCLITDLQLPGMNGLKLQSQVLGQGRDVPIIFVTAFPEERFQKRALDAGAVGFLSKPFDGQTLITFVEPALKTRRELEDEIEFSR